MFVRSVDVRGQIDSFQFTKKHTTCDTSAASKMNLLIQSCPSPGVTCVQVSYTYGLTVSESSGGGRNS